MLQIERSNQFKKDVKQALKRGKNPDLLKEIIELLVNRRQLPAKNRDHKFSGNYVNYRECHIEPDWLLIYFVTDEVLRLERTGTHADLFDQCRNADRRSAQDDPNVFCRFFAQRLLYALRLCCLCQLFCEWRVTWLTCIFSVLLALELRVRGEIRQRGVVLNWIRSCWGVVEISSFTNITFLYAT